VGNAVKFTEQGQVELEVGLESQHADELTLHFAVRDTGIGIPEEKQEFIFEAFSQVDSSTRRRFGGTGLGLSISSRLVEAMKGQIWVESKAGNGSSFHFKICLGAASELLSSPGIEELSLDAVRVLVVDDNFTNLRILTEMLRNWRMETTAASGAEEALSRLRSASQDGNPFELVVTDVHMPEVDGFDLIRNIKSEPGLGNVVVMMLTSGEKRGELRRCKELEISTYLMKPVRRSELRTAIIMALRNQRTGELNEESASSDNSAQNISFQKKTTTALPARILLAEDNSVNQRLTRRMLEKAGHSVVVASTGREAVAALQQEKFDLVLMDVQMPEMDGLEATRAIRRNENREDRRVPIIAITAHAMAGDREECLAAGMDGYISKPIRALDLLSLLEKIQMTEAQSRKEALVRTM
jgi:CheY-like chemotaxis protein